MNRQTVNSSQKVANSVQFPITQLPNRNGVNRSNADMLDQSETYQTGSDLKLSLSNFSHNFSTIPTSLNASHPIQPKLKIGQPNDKYEQEADRVAEQVMHMPEPSTLQRKCACGGTCPKCQSKQNEQTQPKISPLIQRQESTKESDDEDLIQAKSKTNSAPEVTPDISTNIQSLGTGQPLSQSERNFFEPRFGADFSHVRVHTDLRAANAAKSINARAFTHGQNIVFGAGEFSPSSSTGKNLLAHELTHFLQQKLDRPLTSEIQRIPKNKSELEGSMPRYSYSGNCGWIDWGHANPELAQKLINTVKATSVKMRVKETPYFAATYHRPKLVYEESCPSRYLKGEIRRSKKDPGKLHIIKNDYGIREYYLSGFEIGKSDAKRFDKFSRSIQKDLQAAASAQSPPFSSPYYISVSGFTDCIDEHKENLRLRNSRAEAMKPFLDTGTSTKFYQYTTAEHSILNEYISDNKSEEGRRKNRGVLILATPEYTPEGEELETPMMTSKPMGLKLTSVKSRFKVFRSLNYREVLGVSLWIFQDLTKFFEKEQIWTEAIGHSSFSNEDLPSNLIGFYMAAMGNKKSDVRKEVTRLCDVKNFEFSKMMFELYDGRWKKNLTFIPSGFENVWPAEFSSIQPIPPKNGVYELLDYEGTSNFEWFFQDAEGHRSER